MHRKISCCWTQVLFGPPRFVSFDFGDPAILLEQNPYTGEMDMWLYARAAYTEEFLRYWGSVIAHDDRMVKVNNQSFQEIKRTIRQLLKRRGVKHYRNLYRLLWDNFPREIEMHCS